MGGKVVIFGVALLIAVVMVSGCTIEERTPEYCNDTCRDIWDSSSLGVMYISECQDMAMADGCRAKGDAICGKYNFYTRGAVEIDQGCCCKG